MMVYFKNSEYDFYFAYFTVMGLQQEILQCSFLKINEGKDFIS